MPPASPRGVAAQPPGFVGLRLWVEQEVDAHVRAALRELAPTLQAAPAPSSGGCGAATAPSYHLEDAVASLVEEHRQLAAELRQLRERPQSPGPLTTRTAASSRGPLASPERLARASPERSCSPHRGQPLTPDRFNSLSISVADQAKQVRRLCDELAALREDVASLRTEAQAAAEGVAAELSGAAQRRATVEVQAAVVQAVQAYWDQYKAEVLQEATERAEGSASANLAKLRTEVLDEAVERAAAAWKDDAARIEAAHSKRLESLRRLMTPAWKEAAEEDEEEEDEEGEESEILEGSAREGAARPWSRSPSSRNRFAGRPMRSARQQQAPPGVVVDLRRELEVVRGQAERAMHAAAEQQRADADVMQLREQLEVARGEAEQASQLAKQAAEAAAQGQARANAEVLQLRQELQAARRELAEPIAREPTGDFWDEVLHAARAQSEEHFERNDVLAFAGAWPTSPGSPPNEVPRRGTAAAAAPAPAPAPAAAPLLQAEGAARHQGGRGPLLQTAALAVETLAESAPAMPREPQARRSAVPASVRRGLARRVVRDLYASDSD